MRNPATGAVPLARALSRVTPNGPVGLMVLVGCLTEVWLLARGPGNVYQSREITSLVAPTFLVWFWLTLGWLLWLVSSFAVALRHRWQPIAAWLVWIALVA